LTYAVVIASCIMSMMIVIALSHNSSRRGKDLKVPKQTT